MREKEREAIKIFIGYMQKYILLYKIGEIPTKEEMNDSSNHLKKLGYRVYMEEPFALHKDFPVIFKLVRVSGKKENEVLDYSVDIDFRLLKRPEDLFVNNQLFAGMR